jgi:hypothetical protein
MRRIARLEQVAMLKAITVIAGHYDGRRKRIEYAHLTDTLNEAILRMRLVGSTYDFASIELQENDLTVGARLKVPSGAR